MPSIANVADSPPLHVRLKGPLPEAVQYLHWLVFRGLGDTYGKDYVEIEICLADKERYPSLKDVKSLVLHYQICTTYTLADGVFVGPCSTCGRSLLYHIERWGHGNV